MIYHKSIKKLTMYMHGFFFKANKLSLNNDKTNVMLFTSKCVPRTMKGVFIGGNRIMDVKPNFSASSLIIN